MPTEFINSILTRFVVEGEDKVIRANKGVEASTNKVTQAMERETKAADNLSFGQIQATLETARLRGITLSTSEEVKEFARVLEKAEQQTKKTTKETGNLVRTSFATKVQMAATNAIVQATIQLFRAMGREITETVVAVFENTEEGERLADSYDNLKKSVILAIIPFEDTKVLLGDVATAMDDAAASMLNLRAEFAGLEAGGAAVSDEISTLDPRDGGVG